MGRYSKNNSTYTLRKRSQDINNGLITERDWSTVTGGYFRYSKGKRVIYSDGNFIFTASNVQLPSKRNRPTDESVELTYDNVKDSKNIVNDVSLNTENNDIRSCAYYGSCVELIESSISNIIATFPACIYTTDDVLQYPVGDDFVDISEDGKVLHKLSNPFAINLLDEKELFSEYENSMRYIRETFDDYLINDEPINTYSVDLFLDNCYEKNQWYYNDSDKKPERYITKIVINNSNIIYGYQVGKDIVYMSANNIIIKPKDEIIEEYFDNLTGFERQLLNRKSNPLYSNTFITPVEGNLSYKYVNRIYTWPTVCGYCPDIESIKYGSFIEKLLNMATTYDELWCDNLYGRMTHEAIKNFDWTYTRDYIDGEEQDNIDGGNMMQKILHLIGRIFDDIKCHADGIKYSNNVSYNGFNNMPVALLSDKAEMIGWDTKSIIPPDVVDNRGIISLNEDDFINKNNIKWYNATNVNSVNTATTDIEFMKRLLLSTKRIFSSKGTQESIEMAMALFGLGRDVDYTLTEQYYLAEAKEDTDNHLEDLYQEINEMYYSNIYGNVNSETVITAFSNVTLNKIFFKGKKYIIPFYDKNEIYANEIYFEGKGGWGNYDDGKKYKNKHLETVSYLNVVADIKSLTQVSSMSVKKGDIYYVVNLEDYPITYDSDGSNVTHFFYFNSDNYDTENIDKWKNISKDELDKRSTEEADRARYLYDIINTNLGNNPHIGYGRYDNGQDYLNKMSKPFDYKLNKITDGDDNNYIADHSKSNDFNFNTEIKTGVKMHNATKTNENNKGNEIISTDKIAIEYTVVDGKVSINGKKYSVVDVVTIDGNPYTVIDDKVTIDEKEYPVENGKVTIDNKEYEVVIGKLIYDGKEYSVVDGKVTIDGKVCTVVDGRIIIKYPVVDVVDNKVTINGTEYTVENGKVTIDGKEYEVDGKVTIDKEYPVIDGKATIEYDISDNKVSINGTEYTVENGKVTIGGIEYAVINNKVAVEYPVEMALKLNSKVVIIHNKHSKNANFNTYLKETILPYVLQVIPSTTILILENFN